MAPARLKRLQFAGRVSLVAFVAAAVSQAGLGLASPSWMPPWLSFLISAGVPALVTLASVMIALHRYNLWVSYSSGHASCRYGNEVQCKAVFENTPAVMWTADESGEPVEPAFSARQSDSQGSAEQLTGCTRFLDLVHPTELTNVAASFKTLFERGGSHNITFQSRRKDGSYIWVHNRALATYEKDGSQYTVGVATDITEQHLAENQRDQIFNLSLDPMCIGTQDGQFIRVNPAWERAFGFSQDELRKMNVLEIVHPDDRDALRGELQRKEAGHPTSAFECCFVCKDGSQKWFLWSASTDGPEGMVYVVGKDVTVRRQAQEELVRARDAADSASRAKAQFLANMSHEIRTPMNGVIGMIQLLLMTDLSTRQRHYADVAQTSGQALLMLIDDILDLSKLEARKLNLEVVEFDVRSLLNDVIAITGLRAEAKGLGLSATSTTEVPALVCGDPSRLRQVLINLIANAIKFTERGTVAVHLMLDQQTVDRSIVRFSIKDNGIGIAKDKLDKLFLPFVQGDTSTTRKYGGTGLGLAISQQLVELMGGKMGVESEPGVGSTFWFTADFGRPSRSIEQQLHRIGERSATRPALIPTGPQPRHGRILVAEDDPTNQLVIQAQLIELGFPSDTVATGADVVQALCSREYALILMDCDMPIMDGYAATRQVRASGRSKIPIVAVTADAMSGQRERCLGAGMNDYLAKPVVLERLSETLLKWLPAHGAAESRAGARSVPAEDGVESS